MRLVFCVLTRSGFFLGGAGQIYLLVGIFVYFDSEFGWNVYMRTNVGVGCLILYFCEPLYVNSIYISRYGYGTFIRDQLPIFIDMCQASHPGLAT